MLYTPLAEAIETHKTEIARNIARESLARGLKSYQGTPLDVLTELIEKTIAMVGRYVGHGNPDEYLIYVQRLVRDLIAHGQNTDDALVVTEIMIVELDNMITREWPGEANKIERERYIKKIENIHNFGQITFKATRLAIRQESKS